jgi:Flp pilus assembly protein TadD
MVEIEVGMPSPDVSVAIDLVRKKTRSTSSSPVISLREYMVPPKAQKEFELARKEARQQGCSKAIAHFEKGLRIFDQDASAQNELGNCYRKLGQLDRAEDAFRRAQALSDSVYVALNLADVFAVQGRFNDAETVLLKVIQKQPEAGDAYYGLALIYFDQGRLADAQTAALQADGHRHKIADVHVLLAQIYARKQESSAAIEQLQLYLKEAPNGSQSELVRQILGSDQ